MSKLRIHGRQQLETNNAGVQRWDGRRSLQRKSEGVYCCPLAYRRMLVLIPV